MLSKIIGENYIITIASFTLNKEFSIIQRKEGRKIETGLINTKEKLYNLR